MPIFRVFINCVYLQGVEYYQCTYADSPKAWCATGVDSTGTVIPNQWGDCVVSSTSGCAQETITVPSCTTSSGPESGKACVFPFRYKGVVYKVTHHQIFDCLLLPGKIAKYLLAMLILKTSQRHIICIFKHLS